MMAGVYLARAGHEVTSWKNEKLGKKVYITGKSQMQCYK